MNIKKSSQLLGSHVSISGGFSNAIAEGTEIGCTAIQIFTKSNRRWASKAIAEKEARDFISAQKNSLIEVVVSHASYLINLGSVTEEVRRKSLIALVDEIKRCQRLEIPYLILHPGTAEAGQKEATLEQTGVFINQALEETKDCSVAVLVETMAGQGKSIGSSFEELAAILKPITHKERIGICFDTCHTFAAGYDFRTTEGYTNTMDHFDATVGLEFLKLFHINDSKKELNSRVDRHENIGEGCMNLEAFSMIMNDPRFTLIPKILETPHSDELEGDKKNLGVIKSLIK